MGSLRNPVGPLPSTIYWRRRAVLLSLLGLMALLVVWVLTMGGGGKKDGADGPSGSGPATSITPGPSSSGPAISQNPGGRDESDDEDGKDGSGSGDSGGGSGDSEGSGGSGDSGDGSGSGDDGKGGGGAGGQLPAGSSIPNCVSGDVKLKLRSIHNRYEVGEKPKFEVVAQNSAGKACKVDLGAKKTVLTITRADGDKEIWSSADCPEGSGSLLLRVPGDGRVTRTVEWDRRESEPKCATPSAGSAEPGTYLVEAKAPGLKSVQASFVLEEG
ncbi:hypothetical protein [Streptomyces sp. NPDC046925]|uniref:hypothetical protein n=1 Tax=Streptomyces sp. NPDC046925 TaxID=3155375 RepID=UPI0033D8E50E